MTADRGFDFEVICLPRSGSLWLSNFLSYGDKVFCVHEPQTVAGLDLSCLKHKVVGCASSASILYPLGGARKIFIDRDPEEVWGSFSEFTNMVNREQYEAVVDTYFRIRRDGALVVDYKNLTGIDTCRRIWSFATGGVRYEFPYHRWMECSRMNVQVAESAIGEIKQVHRQWP